MSKSRARSKAVGSKRHQSRRGQPGILKKWNEATRKAGYGLAKKGSETYKAVRADARKYEKAGHSAFDAQKKAAREHKAYIPKKGSEAYKEIKQIYKSL
jgi:hypothetical protein